MVVIMAVAICVILFAQGLYSCDFTSIILVKIVIRHSRCLIIPPANYFCGGYTVFTLSLRPSFRPSDRDVLVFL